MKRIGSIDNVLQRCVFPTVKLIVQNRVAMEKRAAATVLPDETHVMSVLKQGSVCHGLGEAPIHSRTASDHFGALVHDALHPALRSNIRRNGCYRFAKISHGLWADRRIDRVIPFRVQEWPPVNRELVSDKTQRRLGNGFAAVKSIAIGVLQLCRACRCRNLFVHQSICVELPRGLVPFYFPVHDWLGGRRFIRLIVAVAPVANQIDDDVFLESLPVFQGQAGNKENRLRIVRIHMEYWCFDHLRDVAAVIGRACIRRPAYRKAYLVVYDNMHSTAGAETRDLRHLERLRNDSLPRKCGVAVNQHGQYFPTLHVRASLLACSY